MTKTTHSINSLCAVMQHRDIDERDHVRFYRESNGDYMLVYFKDWLHHPVKAQSTVCAVVSVQQGNAACLCHSELTREYLRECKAVKPESVPTEWQDFLLDVWVEDVRREGDVDPRTLI